MFRDKLFPFDVVAPVVFFTIYEVIPRDLACYLLYFRYGYLALNSELRMFVTASLVVANL